MCQFHKGWHRASSPFGLRMATLGKLKSSVNVKTDTLPQVNKAQGCGTWGKARDV
jgi:hypothetical protein